MRTLHKGIANVAQLGEFDDIIDVRSPAEYADDHVPGAINCPVLFNEERAKIGTLYVQVSPFEARKLGAVLVARNIARSLEERFLDKPKHWRPLVYCWRGGQRSGAFSHVLREIGWDAHRLGGGYKSWRHEVLDGLARRPQEFQFVVLAGPTGTAKSRILESLSEMGAQVLHLEALAEHKGSVLGSLPERPQPSQRMFESRLHGALVALDSDKPVYVEAESRRIGSVHMPNALLAAIRSARCLRVDASLEARIEFLMRDYDYYLGNPRWLSECMTRLHGLQSNETLAHWFALVEGGQYRRLVEELLERHYDPLYRRSQHENFAASPTAAALTTTDLSPAGIRVLAERILSGEL
jgi:tRNA 2-selenouridine synthase